MVLTTKIVITSLLLLVIVEASIDYNRFHCVTKNEDTGNYLFRSNMPIAENATGIAMADDFGYEDIKNYVASRGVEECGSAPDDFYLVEVTLNNAFDDDAGLLAVRAWHGWPENMPNGRLVDWPLGFAGIIPASRVPEEKWANVSQNMWEVDQLPTRVAALETLLQTKAPAWAEEKPLVILVHCSAGCDRTGEVIGAFRMTHYSNPQITASDMYALDVEECTRAPNYYSTHALEWYCIMLQTQGVEGLGNCTGFATCTPPGPGGAHCTPV
jgi:hypothetical protein